MLHYPDYVNHNVRVIGIDPGCTNLGLARLDFDNRTLDIVDSEAITLNADRLLGHDLMTDFTHSERTTKVMALARGLDNILARYQPSVVCCESPFYNRLRPGAFGALTEILSAIHTSVLNYNPGVQLILYPPSTIKKALGGSAFADKTSVRNQMLPLGDILKLSGPYHITQLDEHSLDALATCFCYVTGLKKG